MLRDYLIPELEKLPQEDRINMWFQHDGAPAHNALLVRRYLDDIFPSRWIGRGGPREWPPRSPDLNPLDFFLWGYMKSTVYANRPRTLEQLKENISQQFQRVTERTLEKVQENSLRRFLLCKQNYGQHFEYLL